MGLRDPEIMKDRRAGVSPASVIRTGWKACATNFSDSHSRTFGAPVNYEKFLGVFS